MFNQVTRGREKKLTSLLQLELIVVRGNVDLGRKSKPCPLRFYAMFSQDGARCVKSEMGNSG